MILGHMIQAEFVADDGSTFQPVTVYFELLRLWDSRAVWWKMETDPHALEANMRFAENRGAHLMFVFGEPPLDAVHVSYNKVPTAEAWIQFVTDTVKESAGRIKYWELWNEPAYTQYWDGTPEELAEQSRVAYQIIKRLQPDAVVLSPSFTEVELPRGRAFLERYCAAGGLTYCDGVAWHGYAGAVADLAGQVAALRVVVGDKPLWNTEYVVGSGLGLMAPSLQLQASLGVKCAVWNAEIPGSEDYTDPTMQRVHDQFNAPAKRGGCSPLRWLAL